MCWTLNRDGTASRMSMLMIEKDIIGSNSHLVAQSGTYPRKATDIAPSDIETMKQKDAEMTEQALKHEFGVEVTPETAQILSLLGGYAWTLPSQISQTALISG